ncbi:MAG: hypothetical protein K0R55_4013 [Sporomusa sp.]|nr:hypothetical protein [Sporomusa sp.]
MSKQDNIRLTAPEIGSLWMQYMSDSMVSYVLQYFINKAQDQEIRPVIQFALSLSEKHIQGITQMFNKEGMPIPVGFASKDVNVNAPSLYLETFYLHYLKHMSQVGMIAYATACGMSVRQDVRQFYYACSKSVTELYEQVTQVLLSKGLYIRGPYIPLPAKAEFVESPSFMGSIMGKNRPLNALEISMLFNNVQTNAMARSLIIGFSQVAQSKDVRDFFVRGQDISKKQIEILSSFLKNDNLSAPETWDSEVTTSSVAPFSDKLMMQHITTLIQAGMANYGAALGASTRVDLATSYSRLMAEIAGYGEDGMQLMIKHGWLEQAPQAADRKELALHR